MAEYLRYIIRNLEPLRIADDAVRQSGQAETLSFIPGSTVRGLVINAMANEPDFDRIKGNLFSDALVFMNALLTTKEHTLIPSPKGFYEDKRMTEGRKTIQNVVTKGDFSEGFKRAGLGRYCYIEDQCIHYYNVRTGSDMKILINTDSERKVFRSGYLSPGHYFEGFIRLSDDQSLNVRIKEIFAEKKILNLGNARTAGMGKCEVIASEIVNGIPYMGDCKDQSGEAYLMLLSDASFRNDKGEISGLDFTDSGFVGELESQMGVEHLTVLYASTSVRTIYGYNRKWRARIPSMPAYEAGSVFHLTFDGTFTAERMKEICDNGIGVRRSEGFGRILFLTDYETVCYKYAEDWSWEAAPSSADQTTDLTPDEKDTLLIAARSYYTQMLDQAAEKYIFRFPLRKEAAGNSQIGTIEEILLTNRYQPAAAMKNIDAFFTHVKEKEQAQRIQKTRKSSSSLHNQIMNIFDKPIEDTLFSALEEKKPFARDGYVMGIPVRDFFSEEDEKKYKIRLLIQMIRQGRKGATA